jgi:hypothetical protein
MLLLLNKMPACKNTIFKHLGFGMSRVWPALHGSLYQV